MLTANLESLTFWDTLGIVANVPMLVLKENLSLQSQKRERKEYWVIYVKKIGLKKALDFFELDPNLVQSGKIRKGR